MSAETAMSNYEHIPGPWYSASVARKVWMYFRHVLPYQLRFPYYYVVGWWQWHVTTRNIDPISGGKDTKFRTKKVSESTPTPAGETFCVVVSPWESAKWCTEDGWRNAGRYWTIERKGKTIADIAAEAQKNLDEMTYGSS